MLQRKSSEVFIDAELSAVTDPADFQVFVKDVPVIRVRHKRPQSSPDRCDRKAPVSLRRHDRIGSTPPKSGQREASLLLDTNGSIRATGEPGNK